MYKRIFDFLFSSLLLVLFSWLFVTVAVIIKFSEPNEAVLFRQKRVGRYGKFFTLLKFRSMTSTKDKNKQFEAGSDLRVTPIGAVLRKTKLDELPQLLNVVKGEMSIIGPRPEVEYWTKFYPEKWAIVHKVRPGITDNASIIFRNEEELLKMSVDPERLYEEEVLPQKLDEYIRYVENMNLFLDLRIVLKTIYVVLFK